MESGDSSFCRVRTSPAGGRDGGTSDWQVARGGSSRGRYQPGSYARGARTWRGSGAGRGSDSGARGGGFPKPNWKPIPSNVPTPPRGKLIESIHLETLTDKEASTPDSRAKITQSYLVASYNWLGDGLKPTILIPGMPALWTPPREARPLLQDNGDFYRDKNASRYPSHPMEPAARSVVEMHPEGAELGIDVVCCGSTLGSLLRFVRGNDRPFQMLADRLGDTVHLTRRENKAREKLNCVRGFGHTFPDAYTTWPAQVKGSVSHQRIVRYSFAGYTMLVRFESDGYIDDAQVSGLSRSTANSGQTTQASDTDSLLSGLMTAASVSEKIPKDDGPLQIRRGGSVVSQDKVFDLKTRAHWRKEHGLLDEELPRLWVSQTPQIVMAYHENSMFPPANIEVRNVGADIEAWEREHASELTTLVALLRKMVEYVRGLPEASSAIEITRDNLATIELREQVAGSGVAFSADFKGVWESWLNGNTTETESDGEGEVEAAVASLEWDDDDSGGELDFARCDAGCGYCGNPSSH